MLGEMLSKFQATGSNVSFIQKDFLKIEKIYVLAINHSPEKYKDIQKRLDALNLPTEVDFEIINGHNGYTEKLPKNTEVYDNWALSDTDNVFWKNPVGVGEIGCTLSHINIWNKIVKDGINRALVLEESIKDLNEPSVDWDFMYLGRYVFDKSEDVNIDNQWVRPGTSYNMHAYMLTQEGAQKLVDYHLERNIFINDEFITATYMTHRRQDIEAMYPNKNIKAISTKEDYITQTSNKETTLVSAHGYKEKPIPSDIEILNDSNWDAWIQKYISPVMIQKDFELMMDELGPNIIEFPLFTDRFCEEFIQLAETKGEWTMGRHEFYPTNDMLMETLGIKDIYTKVIQQFVAPLATWYWTLEGKGWDNVQDESFVIRYRPDKQGQLSVHHDYSSYTIGVKLNDEFEGGGTFFPKYGVNAIPKRNGNAFLHPGMITHRHGGRPVFSGTRYIAVSFIRNTEILK
jgi:GR25 family glycosyltransferase involved in LPS biosynthesis